ncbi:ABC transporter substrate-binding protein [Paenibacillus aquistagni]|uniref:ABC transporter substrate-binding protein n=1 Tax=Paenibacillus aquistagni TaxID=1852522 RepID=UPI001F100426|nr:iron-siderophore ABC transporter substrate-binding protein [Paenibacillus aquistagni]
MMMHKFHRSKIVVMLILLLVLAACSQQGASSNGEAKSNDAPAASQTDSASQEVRKIKHVLGETELKGTPQRVVVLEWTYAEDVLALGVQPVGIADIKGMNQWVRLPVDISKDVVDVGDRSTPNMETIAALKPDLIIGLKYNLEKNYEAFSKIAPTLVFDPYPVDESFDQYQEMTATFNTIADALGKQKEAEAVLQELDQAYAKAKEKIQAAGLDKTPIVLAMGYSNQNAAVFRVSTDNALAIKILEHIGLTNKYKPSKFEQYGFTTTDVEAFPALQDANFLHIIQDDDNVIENQLKNNPVWNGLSFVKENRVYALGGDMWPYGGPLSAKIMAETTAELLTTK